MRPRSRREPWKPWKPAAPWRGSGRPATASESVTRRTGPPKPGPREPPNRGTHQMSEGVRGEYTNRRTSLPADRNGADSGQDRNRDSEKPGDVPARPPLRAAGPSARNGRPPPGHAPRGYEDGDGRGRGGAGASPRGHGPGPESVPQPPLATFLSRPSRRQAGAGPRRAPSRVPRQAAARTGRRQRTEYLVCRQRGSGKSAKAGDRRPKPRNRPQAPAGRGEPDPRAGFRLSPSIFDQRELSVTRRGCSPAPPLRCRSAAADRSGSRAP